MPCYSNNCQNIVKIIYIITNNFVLQIPLKFQVDRIQIFRILLLAKLNYAVLRKTRLKFTLLPTCSLSC